MHITFYGGVREVTGSMHLLGTETDRILLDCGMFQGHRKESDQKNRTLFFDPRILTNIVLSHAHIDHSGRIPLITKNNFKGRVICTRATSEASKYLLMDSAYIQESDAYYLNYKAARSFLYQSKGKALTKFGRNRKIKKIKKLLKKNKHEINVDIINELIQTNRLQNIKPIYTVIDAEYAGQFFEGYPYQHPITIGNDIQCTLYDAGHILGSAISVIKVKENRKTSTICYTGDVGRFQKHILKNPTLDFSEQDQNIDLLILESTYGNRLHDPVKNLKPQLIKVLTETFNRGGTILIPAFAYGRTQEIVYVLHELYNEGAVPKMPIYVDSPLATNLTKVFGEHPETYDKSAHETFLEKGINPFSFSNVQYVSSISDSMALMQEEKPHIVIASSGMCEGGRILHHLRYKIHQSKNTILIVGFMALNTLGSRIQELGSQNENPDKEKSPPLIRILDKMYPLKAQVITIGGFSAHADKEELIRFLKTSNLKIKKIAVVHGEEEQSLAFAESLSNEGFSTFVPHRGETLWLK